MTHPRIRLRTTHLIAALIVALSPTGILASDAPPEQITDDLQVSVLREGVWLHTSWSTYEGTRVPSNGLLVREGDGLVLVDTAWGVATTLALVEWVDRELKLPIVRAIVTHAHADSLGGAPVLVDRRIPFHGHPRTAALAPRFARPVPAILPELAAPGASTSFGSLVAIYPGPGHSEDNIVVWLPEARVLFGGCAVKSIDSTNLGYIGDADLAAWPDSIRRVGTSLPDGEPILVVPGHGEPGGRELLTHTIALLESAPQT